MTSGLLPAEKRCKIKFEGGSAMSNLMFYALEWPEIAKNTILGSFLPRGRLGANVIIISCYYLESVVFDCGVVSEITYSECSATCGSGTKTCERTCGTGVWGNGCPAEDQFQTETCNPQECRKY